MPWRLERYASLPSTSTFCLERARAGEPSNLAILAASQTAGRGTNARSWTGAAGNLFLSVLLRPATPLPHVGQWSLRAGLATVEALQAHAPTIPLRLKWPNDITLDAAKLAGILIETEATPAHQLAFLVIGIGANLAHAPDLPDRPTASLAKLSPSPEEVARTILARLDHWCTAPFTDVLASWTARSHPLGTPMTLAVAGQHITGSFAGLSDTGALRLTTSGVTRSYTAGEARLAA